MLLQSNSGETKHITEWQTEAKKMYTELGIIDRVLDYWERYQKLLGLQSVDNEREWIGRKPMLYIVRNNYE